MADSLKGRRKKATGPKKLMDAYGGADKTIDEMDKMAYDMRPKPDSEVTSVTRMNAKPTKQSISDTARGRYKSLFRRRMELGEAKSGDAYVYAPKGKQPEYNYKATFKTTLPKKRGGE